MHESLSVAVLAGGASAEAAVSHASARAVSDALARKEHRVFVLELDRDLPQRLLARQPDVVFPVTHGTLGEDGCVQGLLEVLRFSYVGSAVLASAIASDKPCAKAIFRAASLPVAPGCTITGGVPSQKRLEEIRREVGPDLVIKPASGGSAIGVRRIRGQEPLAEVGAAVTGSLEVDAVVLVERWLRGADVTCGVLETSDGEFVALPPTLIEPQFAEFYDFRSKYAAGGSIHTCPAPFAGELAIRIQSLAVAAHRAVGARDLSRTDFIVDQSRAEVTLLETNTLPGMTATSLYPEAAKAQGIDFDELCDGLVRRAASRNARCSPSIVPMPL